MRRPILVVVAGLAVLAAAEGALAYSAATRLAVPPRVAKALDQAGRPTRTQCGEIERRGYSVQVVPHSTGRAATAAYTRTYNRWARNRRMAVVRNLVVYGFRVPASEWQTIRRLVMRATT
jgi:hypothetical protein